MRDFAKRISSRKFLLVLAVVLSSIGAALSGEVTWSNAIIAIVTTVLGYLGVEGAADIKAAVK